MTRKKYKQPGRMLWPDRRKLKGMHCVLPYYFYYYCIRKPLFFFLSPFHFEIKHCFQNNKFPVRPISSAIKRDRQTCRLFPHSRDIKYFDCVLNYFLLAAQGLFFFFFLLFVYCVLAFSEWSYVSFKLSV